MLDIGSWEFLVVIVIALIVIGPKDLPAVIRNVSGWVRRAKDLAREFQSGLEDIAREAELDKLGEELKSDLDPETITRSVVGDLEDGLDPDDEERSALEFDTEWNDADAPEPTIADPTIADTAKVARPVAETPVDAGDDAPPGEGEAPPARQGG